MTRPTLAWVCPGCNWPHTDFNAAVNCCRPAITTGWRCENCNAVYESQVDAIECRDESDTKGTDQTCDEQSVKA